MNERSIIRSDYGSNILRIIIFLFVCERITVISEKWGPGTQLGPSAIKGNSNFHFNSILL